MYILKVWLVLHCIQGNNVYCSISISIIIDIVNSHIGLCKQNYN